MKRLDLKHLIFFFSSIFLFASFQNCSNPNSSSNSTSDAEKLSSTLSKTYPVEFDPSGRLLLLSPEKVSIQVSTSFPASSLPVQKLKWEKQDYSFLYVDLNQQIVSLKIGGVINMDWLNFQSLQSVEAVIQCPIPSSVMDSLKMVLQRAKLCKTIKPANTPICLMLQTPEVSEFLLSPQGNPVGLRTDDCSTNSVTDFCEAEDRANFRRATSEIYKSIFITPTEQTVGPTFWSGIPIPMHSNCKFHSYIEPQAQ